MTSWAITLATAEPRTSYDYQEMGLSDAQYDVLREVTLRRSPGPVTQQEKERIAALCSAHYSRVTAPPSQLGRTWPHG